MKTIRKPMLVASVLFGDPPGVPEPDGYWSLGVGEIPRPEAKCFRLLHTFCATHRFEAVAATPVGFSFAAPPRRFADVLSGGDPELYDPQRVGSRYVVQPDGSLPPAWSDLSSAGVGALEIGAAAVGVGDPSRRDLLRSAALAGAIGACKAPRAPWDDTCGVPAPGFADGTAVPTEVGQLPALYGMDPTRLEDLGSEVIVAVVDSGCVGVTDVEPIGFAGLDPRRDEDGHGTAVVDHLRAIAPEATVVMSKYTDLSGFRNYPVAAFQRAVQDDPSGTLEVPRRPHVVLCSWVMVHRSIALQREIADAARRNIVVVFATGNGTMKDSAGDDRPFRVGRDPLGPPSFELARRGQLRTVQAVAHPQVLSVGGVTARCGTTDAVESPVATSFDSELFPGSPEYPARHVPDVCGFVAPPQASSPVQKPPALTLTRTAAGSRLDRKPDGTSNPGEVRTSGTSMAAAQVAGLAALLRDRYTALSERAIRNVIVSTARSLDGDWAERTGFGLAQAVAPSDQGALDGALTWLDDGDEPQPVVRMSLTDRGAPRAVPADLQSASCPDLFLREVQVPKADRDLRLGLAAKHRGDLDRLGRGEHWVYVRVSNRSSRADFVGRVELLAVRSVQGNYRFESLGSTSLASDPIVPGDYRVIELSTQVRPVYEGLLVVVGERPRAIEGPSPELSWGQLRSMVRTNAHVGLRRLS